MMPGREFSVSVIIPVYNAGKFVADSVASALQLSEVKEIVLVEDGSKDNSLEVCNDLVSRYARVKLFRHENGANRGAGASRNLGIQKATCPYVAFLDSDDFYYENRFIRTKQLFEENQSLDGVYELVLITDGNAANNRLFGIKKNVESANLFRYILRGGYYHTNSITVKREFLLRVGPFIQYCWPHEDVELWLRMAFFGNLVAGGSADPVATYRIHDANNIATAATVFSKRRLWKTVFNFFFFKPIGIVNRLIILKQIARFRWKR